jgi:hypothetical protein
MKKYKFYKKTKSFKTEVSADIVPLYGFFEGDLIDNIDRLTQEALEDLENKINKFLRSIKVRGQGYPKVYVVDVEELDVLI